MATMNRVQLPVSGGDECDAIHGALRDASAVRSGTGKASVARRIHLPHVRSQRAGAQIDTTSANGRLFFGIFAALAEFERELIAERTHAGLASARARGRQGGRPRKMARAMVMMAMAAMSDPKANAIEVARRLDMTTTTLYADVNGDGTLRQA